MITCEFKQDFIVDVGGRHDTFVDKLLALLSDITNRTTQFLERHAKECSHACTENLGKVLWRHDED